MLVLRRVQQLVCQQAPKFLAKSHPQTLPGPNNLFVNRMFSSQLAKTLQDEIKLEGNMELSSDYQKIKEEMSQIWSFHSQSGTSLVKMTKTWQDEAITLEFNVQDIAVDYGLNEIPDDVEDVDAEDFTNGLNFSILIDRKAAGKVLIQAIGGEKGLSIRNIRSLPSSEEELKKRDEGYTGPIFQDLDETLQEDFFKFLEERGIDDVLGGFILSYAEEKEEAEYINWLKNLHTFVSK